MGGQWLCINDVVDAFTTWSCSEDSGFIEWDVHNIFVSEVASALFQLIHPKLTFTLAPVLAKKITSLMTLDFDPSGMDSMFIPSVHDNLVSWLLDIFGFYICY